MEKKIPARIGGAIAAGAKKSLSTVWFLLKITVPTSLVVALLGWSGLLRILAGFLSPLMRLIGLPGQAAFVFISGALINNYSAIAVMGSLPLSLRDATILAFMCLTAHNLIVETAVMKSAGSSAVKMPLLRLGTAVVGAFVLNLLLPAAMAETSFSAGISLGQTAFLPMLASWARSTLILTAKLLVFVFGIMVIQSLLDEFKAIDILSGVFKPFMKIFGLPAAASFLWIIINTVGYAYGAGIIKAEYEAGKMKQQEADIFNHHAAVSHSLLEDTILYTAVGVGAFWITVPRLFFAMVVVWLERLRRHRFKKSFRVGTI